MYIIILELLYILILTFIFTDKKEAGTALIDMCRSAKQPNMSVTIGEYQGFKMSVSFDSIFSKFTINLKGQLSHEVEIGADPLGNLQRLSNALEAMSGKMADVEQKLSNVEHQLETAKVEVTKPFPQEIELKEKLERLSELNALLNMDEKGDVAMVMGDDEAAASKGEKEVADCSAKNVSFAEKTANIGTDKDIRKYADVPKERVSIKAKLEAMKVKIEERSGEKIIPQKAKNKDEIL